MKDVEYEFTCDESIDRIKAKPPAGLDVASELCFSNLGRTSQVDCI